MNILLVSGPGISLKEPYNSGIETFIISLANQLVVEGHIVDVIAKEAQSSSLFSLVNPFTPSDSKKISFFKRLKEQSQFRNLDVDSYDVVHYNMFYPHLLQAGLHFNKPSFITLHSPADKKRIAAYKKLSRQSDITFVAISERIKRQWESALGLDIPLINNGININLWPTNTLKSREYLLWSARINEEKNVVAAICLAKHLQLPLKIAGRITDQQYFDTKVKPHLNCQIEYVGHVTQHELSNLAKGALAFLATATWQEPFGLASLEMLASGVPVVGFDTAVPPNWKHESILTAASFCWEDLIEPVQKSNTVSPDNCRSFASSMNIQNMTLSYLKLYQDTLSQQDVGEEVILGDDYVLQTASQQPQIFN